MTGRRARQLYRDEIDRKFHSLAKFFGSYLHQNWTDFHDTPERAVEEAIAAYPLELKQRVQGELRAVLVEFTEDKKLREVLNWGLGVSVHFNRPEQARTFAETVEAKLIQSTENDGRRPGVHRP